MARGEPAFRWSILAEEMKEYMNEAADGEGFEWECLERDEKAMVGRLVTMLAVPVGEGEGEGERSGRDVSEGEGEVEGNQVQGGGDVDMIVDHDDQGVEENQRSIEIITTITPRTHLLDDDINYPAPIRRCSPRSDSHTLATLPADILFLILKLFAAPDVHIDHLYRLCLVNRRIYAIGLPLLRRRFRDTLGRWANTPLLSVIHCGRRDPLLRFQPPPESVFWLHNDETQTLPRKRLPPPLRIRDPWDWSPEPETQPADLTVPPPEQKFTCTPGAFCNVYKHYYDHTPRLPRAHCIYPLQAGPPGSLYSEFVHNDAHSRRLRRRKPDEIFSSPAIMRAYFPADVEWILRDHKQRTYIRSSTVLSKTIIDVPAYIVNNPNFGPNYKAPKVNGPEVKHTLINFGHVVFWKTKWENFRDQEPHRPISIQEWPAHMLEFGISGINRGVSQGGRFDIVPIWRVKGEGEGGWTDEGEDVVRTVMEQIASRGRKFRRDMTYD